MSKSIKRFGKPAPPRVKGHNGMALIEIHADLKLVARQLQRIAEVLERAYPAPPPRHLEPEYIGVEHLGRVTPEKLWDMQNNNQGEEVAQEDQPSR